MEETAASLATPSAAEPRRLARWVVMGAVATVATAGWLWLARPHTATTVSPLPTPAAATPGATSAPAAPPSVAPSAAGPEVTTPAPAPDVALERVAKAAIPAPPPAAPSISPSKSRKEEVGSTSAWVDGAPPMKRLPPPPATIRPLPEDLPPASQTPPRVKQPDPSLGLFRLGVLYQQAGDHRGAVEQYRALLAIDARHVPALNNLAVSLRHLGELKEAADVLRRATALDPTYDTAFTNLGVVRQLQERSDAALEAHLRALAINGKNWESAFNLGLLFWEAGDLERASQFLLKVVALHPHASAYYHLGLIAESQGQGDEALRRYRQALQEREGAQADLRAEAEQRLQRLLGQSRR